MKGKAMTDDRAREALRPSEIAWVKASAAEVDLVPGGIFDIAHRAILALEALAQAAPPPAQTWAQKHGWPEGSVRDEWNEPEIQAAPPSGLDVERLALAFEKALHGWYGDSWTYHKNIAVSIAAEYALLSETT